MASPSEDMWDADDLSRKELQTVLKGWGLPSSGTNAALRQRYTGEMDKRMYISQLQQQHGNSLTPTKRWSTPTCLPVGTAASAAPYPQPVSKTKNKKPPLDEKRLKRYRSVAPAPVQQRISRAKTQRMYLVKRGEIQHGQEGCCNSCDFVVLGSTGNVYTVTIEKVPHCTCPDHARGNLCKHILFVLLKVMSIDSQSPLIFQAAWMESELRDMFAQFEARLRHLSGASASVTIMANATVRHAFAQMEQGHDLEEIVNDTKVARKAVEEDDCPICFDAMSSSEATTFCRARCGKCVVFWYQSGLLVFC
jgi:SWIM zinc finger